MEKNKVSIIVPVYNVEQYIERCLISLIKQTYYNIEIILVDDGSTDNSGKICDKYENIDNRIQIYHILNRGVSNARNYGLDRANGEFITFVDADDFLNLNFISKMMEHQKEEDYDIVISNAIDIYENGKKKYNKNNKSNLSLSKEISIYHFLKGDLFSCVCWGRLYRKEIIKNLSFDNNMSIAEDGKFFLEAIELSTRNVFIKNSMYYYFIRKGSAVHTDFNDHYFDELNFYQELITKYNYDKELCKLAKITTLKIITRCLLAKGIDERNIDLLKDKYKTIYKTLNGKNIQSFLRKSISCNDFLRNIYLKCRRKK